MGLRYNAATASTTDGTLDMYLGSGKFKITTASDHIVIQNNDIKYIIKPDLKNKGLIIESPNISYFDTMLGGIICDFDQGPDHIKDIIFKRYSTLPFITPARNRYTFKETKFAYGGEDEDSISAYIKPYIKNLCDENDIPYRDFNKIFHAVKFSTLKNQPLCRITKSGLFIGYNLKRSG